MAELADAQDLGSCVYSCRFDPCYPHQNDKPAFRLGLRAFLRIMELCCHCVSCWETVRG